MYTKINEKDIIMKLGAIYSKEKTTFTLFSPVADSVFVIFYDKGNDSAETGRLEMMRTEESFAAFFLLRQRVIWMVFIIHMRFTLRMAYFARMIRMQEPAVSMGTGLWLLTFLRLIRMDLQMRTGQSLLIL